MNDFEKAVEEACKALGNMLAEQLAHNGVLSEYPDEALNPDYVDTRLSEEFMNDYDINSKIASHLRIRVKELHFESLRK